MNEPFGARCFVCGDADVVWSVETVHRLYFHTECAEWFVDDFTKIKSRDEGAAI